MHPFRIDLNRHRNRAVKCPGGSLTAMETDALAIPHGLFEIDAERVHAECRDGILALYLPRAEHDKPKSIAIS